MRFLLSTIGTRGDVQPLVALAVQLRAAGQEVRLCAPPDFRGWLDGLGFPMIPVGPELRASMAEPMAPMTPERADRLARESVAAQFAAVRAAATGCDVLVGATALQIAAPSVAEELGIPYVFAAYCPAVLPSARHAPPPLPGRPAGPVDTATAWARDAEVFTARFGAPLNERRARSGLAPVDDVRSYVLTDRPWLAADPTLGPWPEPSGVFQPGAWLVEDDRPLPSDVADFLDAGEPPVYFGFGSMRAPAGDLGRLVVAVARGLGRRAIVARGWGGVHLPDAGPDCLSVGEVNQQALFARVAAVVHHGGAETTTAAALGGAAQVVVPQTYDQYYWAARVEELGIGAAHAPGAPAAGSLASALEHCLRPDVAAAARSAASWVRRDGARVAADRLVAGELR